jgi:hypothetical protein
MKQSALDANNEKVIMENLNSFSKEKPQLLLLTGFLVNMLIKLLF